MASSGPRYYRPYFPSDSEESDASADDSDAESELFEETQNLANLANLPNYVSFAQGLFRAAGPPLDTVDKDLAYAENVLDRHTVYGPMVEGQAGYDIVTTVSELDNVIVLQSLDRDKSIYPQPINCQLMLPRTYINVTRFEIADISFIASFFYFRADKYNISLQYSESGRVTFAPVLRNPEIVHPNLDLTLTIREGTYSIDSLLNELTIQFNTPPLFYDFLNGYSDFFNKFINEGDYSLNFNYPGDYYYDAVTRVYISKPTTNQIVSYYFQQRYALPTTTNNTYTDSQTKVAYYYPVVKEFLLDTLYEASSRSVLTKNGSPLTAADKTHILYSFTGLDDAIMFSVISEPANIVILDAYRLAHTFRYYPVNNYVCTYSSQTNIVCIQSSALNTSLFTLMNVTYSNFLNTQIQRSGISLAQFTSSATQITAYKSIISEMYNVLQTNLARVFGVDYGEYADIYFITLSNVILLKNGLYASNVIYDYNSRLSPFISSNIEGNFRQSNISYWQNMYNIPLSNHKFSNTILDSSSGILVYNIKTLTPQIEHPFYDSSENVYMNPLEYSSDIVVKISPGAYTIIPIKSKIRQTAQIETLPRPYMYLYPEWNEANKESIGRNYVMFSNGSYTHEFPTGVTNEIGSNISYPLIPNLSNCGTVSYLQETFSNQQVTTLSLRDTPNGIYFTFSTPSNSVIQGTVAKYSMSLSFFPGTTPVPVGDIPPNDLSGDTFTDSMSVFVYHDQAAFFADVGPVGKSNGESPFLYKYTKIIAAGSPVQSIAFSAFEGQKYYVFCRATNKLSFTPISFTTVPFISSNAPSLLYCNVDFDPRLPTFNPYIAMKSNFYIAKVNDPDYIKLPIIDSNGYYYNTSNLSCNIGFLPTGSNSPAKAPINILPMKPRVPMGYSSGVSDDLTDYIPIPNTFPPRAFDPMNGYQFRYTAGAPSYNPVSQTYDIGKGENALLYPDGSSYTGSNTVARREKQIVQYTGTHYILTGSNDFTSKSHLLPLRAASIPGLISPFETRGSSGFMFMPEEGTWSIERLTFLSQSSNTSVDFLAIFPSSYVSDVSLKNISLINAICICTRQSSKTYFDTPADAGVPYGTYYTYSKVLSPQSNYVISGKIQSTNAFIRDTNSYYSALAYSLSNTAILSNTSFTLNDFAGSYITAIENLTGTCIPYPDLGLRVSAFFYDGIPTPDSYTLVLSSNRPLNVINSSRSINPNINPNFITSNYYTSQYATSTPIVNSHMHYLQTEYSVTDFVNYTNYFVSWYSVPDLSTDVYTSVYGTLMFQGASFPIVRYPTNSEDTVFSLQTVLTMDMIFSEKTIPLSQYGRSNSYMFLGYENSNFIFKEYNLTTGEIMTYPPVSGNYNPLTYKAQGLVIQESKWWLCYLDAAKGANFFYGSNFTDPPKNMPASITGPFTAAKISIDPANGTNMYFAVTNEPTFRYSTLYTFFLGNGLPITNSLGALQSFALNSNTIDFSVQYIIDREYIYLIQMGSTYAYRLNTITNVTVISAQNLGHQPIRAVAGPNNSIWILFTTSPYMMAYVFTFPSIHIAWQQMFPVMKIELVSIEEKRLSIPDTYNLHIPEWGHSMAFGYSSLSSLTKDLYYTQPSVNSGGTLQWGKESYFQVSDTKFNGYYFNAYLTDLPLQASNTSYVSLRGFSPTESFQTEVRISLPNVYDLGYVSISDIISEIGTINTMSNQYSVSYRQQLSTFDSSFIRSNSDALYGVSSFSVPTTGFSNFIVQYSTLYGEFTLLKSNVDIINTALRSNMQNFIENDMKYILPGNILTRNRFTDSLTFSFLWKTGLRETPPNYANLVDGWGLGWNLGFLKKDDVEPSTVHFAPSLYKISDDFLYLRLNPEFNLNRMSAGTKENYNDSREPSGLTSYYYCKLLLNGYGQTANTFIHSPIILNPPIPKISKMTFQWLDSRGNLLNIPSATDSDWQMTVNIQENVQSTNFVQTSNITARAFLSTTSESNITK
jgi:hypothetical protein